MLVGVLCPCIDERIVGVAKEASYRQQIYFSHNILNPVVRAVIVTYPTLPRAEAFLLNLRT